jgi:hypothetical protein
MSWGEQFAWGFLGSMAVEIVTVFRLLQRSDNHAALPSRYRSVLYWSVRLALAAVGGGLAVAYNIKNPILAANIGAATPAIIMALTRDPATHGPRPSPTVTVAHRMPAPRTKRS